MLHILQNEDPVVRKAALRVLDRVNWKPSSVIEAACYNFAKGLDLDVQQASLLLEKHPLPAARTAAMESLGRIGGERCRLVLRELIQEGVDVRTAVRTMQDSECMSAPDEVAAVHLIRVGDWERAVASIPAVPLRSAVINALRHQWFPFDKLDLVDTAVLNVPERIEALLRFLFSFERWHTDGVSRSTALDALLKHTNDSGKRFQINFSS